MVTMFSNGPEPHVVANCLTVGVGGGPAEAVFFNVPEIRISRDCLLIVTHPSIGTGTAIRVRGTRGALGKRWTSSGGPMAGLLAARAAAAAAPLAGHRVVAVAAEGGGGGESGGDR